MASVTRASKNTGKKVKQFKTLQELSDWLNTGKPVVSLTTQSGQSVGALVSKQPSTSAYVNGASVYSPVVINGAFYVYNWTCIHVGYFGVSTKEEIQEELKVIEEEVSVLKAKLAYLEETKQEEFDETEFKVWNTLQILSQKKSTDLEKAKAIAALINS